MVLHSMRGKSPIVKAMRLLLQTTAACMMLLVATRTMAQDCTAIQRACVAHCLGGVGAGGDLSQILRVAPQRIRPCIIRCTIAPCGQTGALAARLCDATAQSICNNGFRACTDSCIPSTATTAAEIEVRRRVRPSVAAKSRHVWGSASAT